MMKLFEPGQIGKLRLKNRIVMSPMGCGALVDLDGSLSQRGIDYFAARAKGGAGMISTGSVRVTREFEKPPGGLNNGLMLDNKLYARWVHELACAAHDYGAKLAIQLSPGLGRCLSKHDIEKVRPIGASAVPCLSSPKTLTHPLTLEEIGRIHDAFEAAAHVVKDGGADLVELNCHAGYLADQFMTPLWNKRTDQYGGDLDNRMRFLVEIVARLKKVLGTSVPVTVKYALTHYMPGGREAAEGVEIARKLEAAGVDGLTIDSGCRETQYWTLPSEFLPEGCNLDLAAMVSQAVNIPVIAVGKLGNAEIAEDALQSGKAQFISLGRTLIADPDWPIKVRQSRLKDIIPCVDCFEGCHKHIHEGKAVGCAVNAATGNEREFQLTQAAQKKNVLVIGGGPGGMEAARVAAHRGHKVSLWEKDRLLYGNLIPGSASPFKAIYRRLNDYLSHQLEKEGVDIVLGKEATRELVEAAKADVIIIATGSAPIIPKIPGVERPNVVTANDVLTEKHHSGQSVVIVGGGVVGCETAIDLARQGKQVTIVELLGSLGRDFYYINRMHMLKLIEETGVKVLLESKVLEIREDGVLFADKTGTQSMLNADTVILAVGFKARTDLTEQLEDSAPEVFSIGDCLAPRKVMQAMQEGYRVARLI